MYGKLGRSCPLGLGNSSRNLSGSPAFIVLSWNIAVNYALFRYFWINLPDFLHFWVDFGYFWADFEHFQITFINRFSFKRIRFPVGLEFFAGLFLNTWKYLQKLAKSNKTWKLFQTLANTQKHLQKLANNNDSNNNNNHLKPLTNNWNPLETLAMTFV